MAGYLRSHPNQLHPSEEWQIFGLSELEYYLIRNGRKIDYQYPLK
jgi:hypothetical protein